MIQVGPPQQLYAEPVSPAAARLTGPASILSGREGPLLVRPDWVRFGGNRAGVVVDVQFRGSYTDYALQTPDGDLVLRSLTTPIYERGDKITWSLDHAWPLPGDH